MRNLQAVNHSLGRFFADSDGALGLAASVTPANIVRSSSTPHSTLSQSVIFSLTREPMDRFVSGYTELMFRAFEHRKGGPLGEHRHKPTGILYEGKDQRGHVWTKQRLGSLQHAADFVRALIEGKIADGHVKLQAAFLLTVGTIDVLGRVEDIPTTWRVLRARMRCSGSTAFHDYDNAYLLAHHQHQGSNKSQHTPHHPFFQLPVSVQGNVSLGEVRKESPSSNASNASTSYGTFSSSHDPHGTSSAMHALLRTDERIHAALLLVLNPDYLLLDYPMPTWPGLFAR